MIPVNINITIEIINLKHEDRPLQLENINFAETLFRLVASEVKPSLKADSLIKKQQEIMSEIYESEEKYSADLKLIQSVFYFLMFRRS